jgi:hypothetical protein
MYVDTFALFKARKQGTPCCVLHTQKCHFFHSNALCQMCLAEFLAQIKKEKEKEREKK